MDTVPSQRASISGSASRTATPPATPLSTTAHIPSPEICVICLDLLARSETKDLFSEAGSVGRSCGDDSSNGRRVATALPCHHAQFHQSCLGTWLSHSSLCPLCKTDVLSISIHRDEDGRPEIIDIPAKPTPQPGPPSASFSSPSSRSTHVQPSNRRPPGHGHHHRKSPVHEDPILTFRRQLYARGIPSLYMGRGIKRGPHHHSRLPLRQTITPASFCTNNPHRDALLHRATIWIRRELQLFPFLHPTSPSTSTTPSPSSTSTSTSTYDHDWTRPPPRRTTASFLLPFILSVLRAIDLKGSAGQAQLLVGEYLGRANAGLFCHELHAFLGSRAETVRAWDEGVQYWFDDGEHGEGRLCSGLGEVLGFLGAGE